jgi:hypothetical protein
LKKNKYLTFLDNKVLDDDYDYLGIRLKLALDNLNLSTGLVAILSNDYTFYSFRNRLVFRNPSFLEIFSSSLGIYLEKFEHTDREIACQLIAENSKRNIAPPMLQNQDTGEYEIVTGYQEPYQVEVVDARSHQLKLRDVSKLAEIEWIMLNSPVFMKPIFRDLKECLALSLKNQVIKNSYNSRHHRTSKDCQLTHLGNALKQELQSVRKSRMFYLQGLKEVETKLDYNFEETCQQLEAIIDFLDSVNGTGSLSREQLEEWLNQEVHFQELFEKEVIQKW